VAVVQLKCQVSEQRGRGDALLACRGGARVPRGPSGTGGGARFPRLVLELFAVVPVVKLELLLAVDFLALLRARAASKCHLRHNCSGFFFFCRGD
jgi:hypothetical protein